LKVGEETVYGKDSRDDTESKQTEKRTWRRILAYFIESHMPGQYLEIVAS